MRLQLISFQLILDVIEIANSRRQIQLSVVQVEGDLNFSVIKKCLPLIYTLVLYKRFGQCKIPCKYTQHTLIDSVRK